MALSTFHPFPNLPAELRLRIWELAIRPTDGKHGMHHFTILGEGEDTGDSFVLVRSPKPWSPCHIATAQAGHVKEDGSSNPTRNKSAYLWDYGLWEACTDSRGAIMRHFKFHEWDQKRHHSGMTAEPAPSRIDPFYIKRELAQGGDVSCPARATARRGDEGWQLTVQPFMDLFCLEGKDWKAVRGWISCLNLFPEIPLTSNPLCFVPLRYIAVEFNPSWNTNLPSDISHLATEPSARGFVARTVCYLARKGVYLETWLIDRGIHWQAKRYRDSQLVSYDYDQDFIEVESDQVEVDKNEKSAHYFIEQLFRIANPILSPRHWDLLFRIDARGWAESHIGVLACRGNQFCDPSHPDS